MGSGREFEGKVAVVTGGGSGIGAAVCRRLAAGGAAVAAWDLNLAGAEETVEGLREAGRALALEVDVADAGAVERAAGTTADQLGPPTLLVTCAGIREIRDPLELDVAGWRRVMSVNLDGPLYCALAVAPFMVEAGGGAIVNISSTAGLDAYPRRTSYVTSKTGVIGLTRSLALDLASRNIRVNAVAPGHVLTPLTQPFADDPQRLASIRSNPIPRWARSEEIAAAIAFLLSDEASYITGVVLPVDGGHTATRG